MQKRFKFPDGSVELYAEKVNNRGLCAIAQAEVAALQAPRRPRRATVRNTKPMPMSLPSQHFWPSHPVAWRAESLSCTDIYFRYVSIAIVRSCRTCALVHSREVSQAKGVKSLRDVHMVN